MDKFVTIMTFTYPSELAILRAKLEDDKIEVQVLNELTVQVIPFYSNAIGGVKLQVKEIDIERTVDILKAGCYVKDGNKRPSINLIKVAHASSGLKCCNCGSEDVLKNRISGQVFAFSVLLLGFPLPFISKMYHCFNCGEDFKRGKIIS